MPSSCDDRLFMRAGDAPSRCAKARHALIGRLQEPGSYSRKRPTPWSLWYCPWANAYDYRVSTLLLVDLLYYWLWPIPRHLRQHTCSPNHSSISLVIVSNGRGDTATLLLVRSGFTCMYMWQLSISFKKGKLLLRPRSRGPYHRIKRSSEYVCDISSRWSFFGIMSPRHVNSFD